jgi:hypothetical protein
MQEQVVQFMVDQKLMDLMVLVEVVVLLFVEQVELR